MQPFKRYQCTICGWIYDEDKGEADSGLPPGTRWVDVSNGWKCPDCGTPKHRFDMKEI